MDRRQILRLEIDVLFGHLQTGMPEDFHQHELGAAPSDIVRGEGVADSVESPGRRVKLQAPA